MKQRVAQRRPACRQVKKGAKMLQVPAICTQINSCTAFSCSAAAPTPDESTFLTKFVPAFQFQQPELLGMVDKSGQPLKASFLPLDVELDNVSELLELLHHPQHLRLVQNFVRQWNSLTDTKQRLISKRGLTFRNPLAAYDTVRTDLANNKQRYQTKEDQAKAALKAAREVNGDVRVLSTQRQPVHATRVTRGDGTAHSDSAGSSTDSAQNWHSGNVQVMSAEGTPLCLHCQQPCCVLEQTTLLF